MNRHSARAGTIVLGSLAASLLLAAPANAIPKLPRSTQDQIRQLCEASSLDLAGKREERRCRAEWKERLQQLTASEGRVVRLDLR